MAGSCFDPPIIDLYSAAQSLQTNRCVGLPKIPRHLLHHRSLFQSRLSLRRAAFPPPSQRCTHLQQPVRHTTTHPLHQTRSLDLQSTPATRSHVTLHPSPTRTLPHPPHHPHPRRLPLRPLPHTIHIPHRSRAAVHPPSQQQRARPTLPIVSPARRRSKRGSRRIQRRGANHRRREADQGRRRSILSTKYISG